MNDFFGSLLFMGVPSKEKFSVSVVVRDKQKRCKFLYADCHKTFFLQKTQFICARQNCTTSVCEVCSDENHQMSASLSAVTLYFFFLFCFVLAKSVEMTL